MVACPALVKIVLILVIEFAILHEVLKSDSLESLWHLVRRALTIGALRKALARAQLCHLPSVNFSYENS